MKSRGVAGNVERATDFLHELQDVDWRRYGQSMRSRKELAEMLLRLTGSNQPIKYAPRSQATLVRNRIGSPKRAAAEIGFVAEMPLEQGLRELIG